MIGTDPRRILLVDDEQSVLDALCRQHRKNYTLVPACGSAAGLLAVAREGPFAVVVTDYQMPGLNGTQFLAKAGKLDPDMIRIMLTGNADLQTAIEAVNRGHIFRFLTKPCDPQVLRGCLDAALEQHRLRNAERDLLEHTVRGSIEVMVEVLALSNPAAFGRATRIRDLVRHVVRHLNLPDGWQYETAALLSQIGHVAIPDDLFERMAAGEELPAEQLAMLNRHPEVARDLIQRIPRLQAVADMVYHQRSSAKPTDQRTVVLGGRILAAALDFEELLSVGATREQALDALEKAGNKYDRRVLDALATTVAPGAVDVVQVVSVLRLRVEMVILEDVRDTDNHVIVGRGHTVTEGSLQRLCNHAKLGQLGKTEFRVQVPQTGSRAARPSAA